MKTHEEALKMALEALNDAWGYGTQRLDDKLTKAIKALEEALAKQEQGEPVTWPIEQQPDGSVTTVDPADMTPEQLQLYTTPQQRKPLTDEQIMALLVELCVPTKYEGVTETFTAVVRAIEAAHGIKE